MEMFSPKFIHMVLLITIVFGVLGGQVTNKIFGFFDGTEDKPDPNDTSCHPQGTKLSHVSPSASTPKLSLKKKADFIPVEFHCPQCNSTLEGGKSLVGQTVDCPVCGHGIKLHT
jgi:hypothetical protein